MAYYGLSLPESLNLLDDESQFIIKLSSFDWAPPKECEYSYPDCSSIFSSSLLFFIFCLWRPWWPFWKFLPLFKDFFDFETVFYFWIDNLFSSSFYLNSLSMRSNLCSEVIFLYPALSSESEFSDPLLPNSPNFINLPHLFFDFFEELSAPAPPIILSYYSKNLLL